MYHIFNIVLYRFFTFVVWSDINFIAQNSYIPKDSSSHTPDINSKFTIVYILHFQGTARGKKKTFVWPLYSRVLQVLTIMPNLTIFPNPSYFPIKERKKVTWRVCPCKYPNCEIICCRMLLKRYYPLHNRGQGLFASCQEMERFLQWH